METLSPHPLENVDFLGGGLSRPECALAHSSGFIFTPDWTGAGGVSIVSPDGSVKRHLAKNWANVAAETRLDAALRPNGICLLEGGDFLLAHLGDKYGGVFRLTPDGTVHPYLIEVDGERLPPTNFVTVDQEGRVWITVSTRKTPRALAYRSDISDGFIVCIDDGKAQIMNDQLGYTNECMPHPDGKRLFVNETFSRKLTSFDIGPEGTLTNRTTVAKLGHGTFPDGLAFDEHGDAWLTSIVSNRVLRVNTDGKCEIWLEDADPDHLDWVENAYEDHAMNRPHLDKAAGRRLRNISNLAFYGPELDRAVLGCLLGDALATIKMPVRGQQPIHWTFDISPLITALDLLETVEIKNE